MSSNARRTLRHITRHWEQLGAQDPLWAVYVAPGKRGGSWDQAAFFATGRNEIERVVSFLRSHDVAVSGGVAIDFGCGVGRLSRPLSEFFDRVIGIDVSEPMLDKARELNPHNRIDFILNQHDDLRFVADESIDLVYSSLVLQHLSRPLAGGYIGEFVRVLSAQGTAVIQVATRPTASVKGVAFRLLPPAVTGFLQTRLLRYPAPMRMEAMSDRWVQRQVSAAGGRVVARATDTSYRGHWVYTRYLIKRAM